MAPVMEQMGETSIAEIALDTLHARIHVDANGSAVVRRYEVGAWARLG